MTISAQIILCSGRLLRRALCSSPRSAIVLSSHKYAHSSNLPTSLSGLCRDRLLKRSVNSTTPRRKNSSPELLSLSLVVAASASDRIVPTTEGSASS
jgi:hypothetical protein